MTNSPIRNLASPLQQMLQIQNQEFQKDNEGEFTYNPTEREISILQQSNLAGRNVSLLLRRTTGEGRLLPHRLHETLQNKLARFEDSEFINTAPVSPGCNWLSVEPRNINGRIKCLAIHPTDGQIMYAGAANGGVWKTTDGGQSWTVKLLYADAGAGFLASISW